MSPFAVPTEERFWSRVVKSDGCWEWTGAPTPGGYGTISLPIGRKGKNMRAHRYSYLLHYGPFDERLFVCHTCDNPKCVRPDHLFLGEPVQNTADMVSKGRHAEQRKTSCPRGHEYDAENTYTDPTSNKRACRACRVLRRHQHHIKGYPDHDCSGCQKCADYARLFRTEEA